MAGLNTAGFGTPIAIDTLFRDAYSILEEIQRAPDRVDFILGVLVQCHRAIRNLERIHQNYVRINGPDPVEDPFRLRQSLDGFVSTCNALNYMLNPFVQPTTQATDGCLPGTQWTWKRKQMKTLEQELCDHQRTLTMVLANAMYTTTLEMQRQSRQHDPAFSFILRQVEKRHTMFDCIGASNRESAAQRLTRTRADEIDWEFCLRRYFDYLESWTKDRSNLPFDRQTSISGGSRRSSLVSEPDTYAMRRSATMDSSVSYSSHRSIEETDTSRFYRKPRDRDSLRLNSLTASSRPSSIRIPLAGESSSSDSSSTLVQQAPGSWQEPSIKSKSAPLLALSPNIDRTPSSTDIPWERLAIDVNGTLIEDLLASYPELKPAHRDIVWETRNMTATEARAYVQGRLAAVPTDATNAIKERLMRPSQRRHSAYMPKANVDLARQTKKSGMEKHDEERSKLFTVAGNIFSVRPNITESPRDRSKESRTQSLLLSSIRRVTDSPPNTAKSDKGFQDPLEKLRDRERKKCEKRRSISSMQISAPINSPKGEPPAADQKPQPRAIASLKSNQTKTHGKTKKSRVSALKLGDIRPLTAISERSFSAKSWKSSRSRVSNNDIPEMPSNLALPVPATRARLSVTSLELVVEVSREHQAERPGSDGSDRDKELPPIPDSEKAVQLPAWLAHPMPLGSNPVGRPRSRLGLTMESATAPRASAAEKLARHNNTRMSLPPTVKTGRQLAAARDAMGKNESGLRLLALQDSMEKEFGVWLKALPYIEGRVGTPNSKRDSWKAMEG